MSETVEIATTLARWDVPVVSGEFLSVEARAGEVVTILGANGSGKSALAAWMSTHAPSAPLKRVLAQRKLWFQHAGPAISSADRETYVSTMTRWDRTEESRYIDRTDSQRSSIALFDLIARINHESRRVAALYDGGANRTDVDAAVGDRLLDTLNTVLERAGLHIEIDVTESDNFVAQHRNLGAKYPIYLMSDGEKSALFLAADILTALPGTTIIIDEPERHLHRSISAGLIEAIIAARPDCAFVVLTHDLDLASGLADKQGATFSVLGVKWQGEQANQWDIHEVPDPAGLSETARRAILGGRRRILFIEGESASLDLALYRVLFPEWFLVPSGGCDLVIRSVTGLRESQDHHWVNAVGLVDGDGRTAEERASLVSRGVHVLPVSEIENLYFETQVLRDVATKQAMTLGRDSDELLADAEQRALKALGSPGTLERLAAKLAKDAVARKLVAHMPETVGSDDITIRIPSPYAQILSELQAHLKGRRYDDLVRLLPIRNTSLRNEIAGALGFRSAGDYQRAALVCIASSPVLRAALSVTVGSPTRS
ncbi:AAA family ATPase [Paenarthrobacter sp. NPDC058040]|uniref:AAA family ATPase n=1 Tax=unclassified Paenarthrobacter TaxID=2634190 RepID=UPI0036DEECC6